MGCRGIRSKTAPLRRIVSLSALLLFLGVYVEPVTHGLATGEVNRCSKVPTCSECIVEPGCAWCTNESPNGACMYKSQLRYVCDGMKDSYITAGYACPNQLFNGGGGSPKREKGFGGSGRVENMTLSKKIKDAWGTTGTSLVGQP